jgi:hypothetical protein
MKKLIKISLLGLGLLLAIGVVSAAAGSHGAKTTGTTQSPALQTTAQSAPNTVAQNATAPAKPQLFTGNGSENLGTIVVPKDSTLTWNCGSCTQTGMEILANGQGLGNDIAVMQTATSGKSAVTADTYRNVTVNADGPFTITITPNA